MTVKSADRTLEVLEALAGSPERRGLGELARDLGIPKSSLHGLLRTMMQRGWVETDASGARFAVIVGEAEAQAGQVSVKPLRELSEQVTVSPHEAVQIIAAALATFGDHGFANTTLDQIAMRAGISMPVLLNLYPTKEDVFRDVVRSTLIGSLSARTAASVQAQEPSAADAVRTFARKYWTTMEQPELVAIVRLVIGEMPRFPENGSAASATADSSPPGGDLPQGDESRAGGPLRVSRRNGCGAGKLSRLAAAHGLAYRNGCGRGGRRDGDLGCDTAGADRAQPGADAECDRLAGVGDAGVSDRFGRLSDQGQDIHLQLLSN